MSTAEALCIKNTLIDQIGLISKHKMFCFEKTVFKTFELLLEYFIFRKTVRKTVSLHGLNLVCTKL
jgi:type VI protein secretion system component VasA